MKVHRHSKKMVSKLKLMKEEEYSRQGYQSITHLTQIDNHLHTHVGDLNTTMYDNSTEPPCPLGAALHRMIFKDRLWAS